MAKLRQAMLKPCDLLLDPNNYRFQESEGFLYAAQDRFHEKSVQDRTYQRLKAENLQDLKRSIQQNGYIPVERLVVRPYPYSAADAYLVVEGNRRLAALRWLQEDNEAGVSMREDVLASIAMIPVLIVEAEDDDDVFVASLMGIRHVSGIREWGGYQRAKLVVHMRDDLHLDTGQVAERLALSAHEVNRRYRAFKALQQMQANEEYAHSAVPSMYPIFHEAVSLPVVREWLEWDDSRYCFTNDASLEQFYSLITPRTDDETGLDAPPAIATYLQVRQLRVILPKADAKRALVDLHRPFEEALLIATRDEMMRQWIDQVRAAVDALTDMGIEELKRLDGTGIALLQQVCRIATERLDDHQRLTNR